MMLVSSKPTFHMHVIRSLFPQGASINAPTPQFNSVSLASNALLVLSLLVAYVVYI
jgi:hypothetical protein